VTSFCFSSAEYAFATGLLPFSLRAFLLPQPGPNELTAFAQQPQKEPNLLVYGLWGCLFPESLLLVTKDHGLVGINDHLGAEQSGHVPDRVLCKRCTSIAENVAFEITDRDLTDGADPLVPAVLDGVESFFKLTPALLFGEFRQGLRCRLR
jgi:hypothetical protein